MKLLCILLWFVTAQMVSGKSPHIIMIVADDLGFNDVSFHGSTQIPTPNIDKLANNGIILNNYYVLPICTPTRSAIMTGRYPIHTGMQSGTIYGANAWGVSLQETFLPQYLKEAGYMTHAVGKWHLGFFTEDYTPTHRGFDTFYGFYGGQADYWDHSLASNGYWGLDLHKDTPVSSEPVYTQWGNYSSQMYSMEAIDRIASHDLDKPLFLYLSYQAVHSANLAEDPLQAPQKWLNKFSHIKHEGRRKFAAMVASMDDGIGSVYKALEERGMLDDSVIIFTSDNGGPPNGLGSNWATNYPLRGAKTTVYEGGVRAAGCIWSKNIEQHAHVSHDLMHVSDWLPTLLSAAGVDTSIIPGDIDGMNLWDTLMNGSPSPRKEVLLNIDPQMYNNAALRVGEWKLVNQSRFYDGWYPPPQFTLTTQSGGFRDARVKCSAPPAVGPRCGGNKGKPCLFNLSDDPCEHEDLSEKFPLIYNLMLNRLEDYRRGMVEPRRNTVLDTRANPKLHNGVWVSWLPNENKSSFSFSSLFKSFPIKCQLQ